MKFTEADKRILQGLDFHAREPLSRIAKRLNISKQRLAYNIKKLEERGIIQGYYTDINPSKLGLVIYLLYFKFHNLTNEKEQELIRHFNAEKRISVNVSTQGKWDHSIAIFAKDLYEYRKIYDNMMKDYETYVKEKQLTIITDFWYYPQMFSMSDRRRESLSMHGPLEESRIDSIDKTILSKLAEDARISLLDLSRITNLTPNAVKARIKQLEKKGIIMKYRVMLDYEKLGKLHYRIFLFLENDRQKQDAFRKFLSSMPEVISITKTEGYCELEARIIVDSLSHFYEFIQKLKKNSPILKDYEPLVYFKFYKSLNYYPVE